MKIRWQVLLLILGLSVAPHVWAATSVYDLAGRWHGELQFGEMKLRLLLKITKEADGHLAAKLDAVDQGARNLPVTALLFNDPEVRLEFDPDEAVFKGALSADRREIKGAIDDVQGVGPILLTFQRAPDVAPPEPPRSYTFAPGETRDVRGFWKTSLRPEPDSVLRIGLKIGRHPDNTFSALMDILDDGAKDIPASTVTVIERKARFEWQGLQLVFEAELDAEGDRLTGDWKQGPKPITATFERIQKPLALLPDNLSFDPNPASPQDPRGYWGGVVDFQERRSRLFLTIGQAPNGTFAGTLANPDLGDQVFPLSLVSATNAQVRLEVKTLRAVFTGVWTNKGKAIDGKWEREGHVVPVRLERTRAPESASQGAAE